MSAKLTTEQFINRATLLFGDKYVYDKVIYSTARIPVMIGCREHGYYMCTPDNHLRGKGCPKCRHVRIGEARRVSYSDFLNRAIKKFGDALEYDETTYTKLGSPMRVCCKKHGWFIIKPEALLYMTGCPKCGKELGRLNRIHTTDKFISKAKNKFGDRYDYSQVAYITTHTPVIIRCIEHDISFEVTPHNHLQGALVCEKCTTSRGAYKIRQYLQENSYSFDTEYMFPDCVYENMLRFDFAVYQDCTKQTITHLIEFDGRQHFVVIPEWGGIAEYEKVQKRDAIKNKYCSDKQYRLIRIPHWDEKKIEQILQKELSI